jgi:WD40 repeat protein
VLKIAQLGPFKRRLQALALSSDGALLAAGLYGGHIQLWRMPTFESLGELPRLSTEYGTMSGLVLNHNGTLLVNVCDDSLIAWDVPACRERKRLIAPPDEPAPPEVWDAWKQEISPYVLAYSASQGLFACGAQGSGRIKVWSEQSLVEIAHIKAHDSHVMALAFNPIGTILASSGHQHDTRVSLWDLLTGNQSFLAIPEMHWLTTLIFHQEGRLLAGGGLSIFSRDARPALTIHLWDIETGALVQSLRTDYPIVQSLAFHPGGRILASGAMNGTITLWDTATWEPIVTARTIGNVIGHLLFMPDGRTLLSEEHWSNRRESLIEVWALDPGP